MNPNSYGKMKIILVYQFCNLEASVLEKKYFSMCLISTHWLTERELLHTIRKNSSHECEQGLIAQRTNNSLMLTTLPTQAVLKIVVLGDYCV